MTGLAALVWQALLTTLRDPRQGARQVLSLAPPMEARWLAAGIVIVLSLLLSRILLMLTPAGPASPFEAMLTNPVAAAVTQALLILGLAFGMSAVAARFGGRARFADGLLLAAWLEFVLLAVQVALIAVILVVPVLSFVAGAVSVVLFFWYLTVFTAEANGFRSTGKTFAGVIVGLVAGVFLMALVLTVLGLAPQIAEVPAGV